MFYLLIFLFITFSIGYVIQQVAKFVLRKFYNQKPIDNNPYINYHKTKMINDDNYEDYLEWLKNKDVYGSPVEKFEAPEDVEASKKVKILFPRRKFTDDDKLF